MKKMGLTSLFSLMFLLITTFTCKICEFIPNDKPEVFVIFGLIGCAISGLLYVFFRKHIFVNIIAFLLNALFLGSCLHGWYLFRDYELHLWVIILIDIASVLYLWLYYAFLYIPFVNRHYTFYVFAFIIVSLIAYILLICFTTTNWMSTFGWYMIIEVAFIFALSVGKKNLKDQFRAITISTYSVIIVAIIMLVFILLAQGGGDIDLDPGITLDGGGGYLTSPRKNKKI